MKGAADKTFNAGNETDVETVERVHRGREAELNHALSTLLAQREGRVVLWWIIRDLSGWFDRTFTGNEETYFNEGRRQVGTSLFERLNRLRPTAFGDLINEMNER